MLCPIKIEKLRGKRLKKGEGKKVGEEKKERKKMEWAFVRIKKGSRSNATIRLVFFAT